MMFLLQSPFKKFNYGGPEERIPSICANAESVSETFKPGYTAPPPMFQLGRIPVNFRGNWAISRRDLNNACIIALVPPDHNFIDPEFDEYAASAAKSEFCCRSVAIIVLLLQACGIILPIYIILKAVNAIRSCRQHQEQSQESTDISDVSSDEEAGLPPLLHQARDMRVH